MKRVKRPKAPSKSGNRVRVSSGQQLATEETAPTMSQWAKVQRMPQVMQQMRSTFDAQFPIEVRQFLGQWIESQDWPDLEEGNAQDVSLADQLCGQLIQLLETKAQEMVDDRLFLIKMKLQESAEKFNTMCSSNPVQFVQLVRKYLEMERTLIQQEEESVMEEMLPVNPAVDHPITRSLEALKVKTQTTDSALRQLQQDQELFIIDVQDLQNRMEVLERQVGRARNQTDRDARQRELEEKKKQADSNLQARVQPILNSRQNLARDISEIVEGLKSVQSSVLDEELVNWKRQQQLRENGAICENTVDALQLWCETLADIIWLNRMQVIKMICLCSKLEISEPQDPSQFLPQLNATIMSLLSTLLANAFVVETHPPQVLKRDCKFSSSVRLLTGGKLNICMNPPEVKASIINEQQARDLLQEDTETVNKKCGDILNNVGTMEYDSDTSHLGVCFRNMQLKKISRGKRSTEAVTEEKFSILFQTKFNVGGTELPYHVWTMSLPVIVIVNGNQECAASASVLWDNGFAAPGRQPFVVPEVVPWPHLAEQLNLKFRSMTKRGLTNSQLNYIASRLFGPADDNDYSHHEISWSQFCKNSLHGKDFKFWQWIYTILKLIRDHLSGPWKDGSIMGFVSKEEAQDMLYSKQNGTFLLRFSDTKLGGITIAWIMEDASNPGQRGVWNLVPFTGLDFHKLSLADRIKDLGQIVYLYPSKAKDLAFKAYYSPTVHPSSTNGYIPAVIVNKIQMPENCAPMSRENPQTPQVLQPQSPFESINGHDLPSLAAINQDFEEHSSDDAVTNMDELPEIATDYNADDIDVNMLLGDDQFHLP